MMFPTPTVPVFLSRQGTVGACLPSRASGSALIISILLLLVMSVLGLAAMQTTTLQERMSMNMRDRHMAFQAAEAALRDAEQFLFAGGGLLATFNGEGLCPPVTANTNPCTGDDPMLAGDAAAWAAYDWENQSMAYSGAAIEGLAQPPRYVIERLDVTLAEQAATLHADEEAQGEVAVFRITARSTGGTDVGVVILQSTFVVR